MTEENQAIDPRPWGDYVGAGRGHFERVERSYQVFSLNARELVDLLHTVETDFLPSMRLMTTVNGAAPDEAFRHAFWSQLDQRLHNMLAAATSLVDHTRPLARFHDHEAAFPDEWTSRSEEVRDSPRAQFLRKLRNYLLHYGMAPMSQTMRLGPPKAVEGMDCCNGRNGIASKGCSSRASRAVRP